MNKEMFDRGLEIRKKVLGAEFVEKSLATADDFTVPMQELVTEYCWGGSGDARVCSQDAQHDQPRDDQRAQPPARAEDACQGRAQQRRHQR